MSETYCIHGTWILSEETRCELCEQEAAAIEALEVVRAALPAPSRALPVPDYGL
jgi:hypothetical protein